jgi:hypothetical protein
MSVRLDTMGHLTADTEAELHAVAASVGLRREWFQAHRLWHYDVTTATKRRRAIRAGALSVSPRDSVRLHPVHKEPER